MRRGRARKHLDFGAILGLEDVTRRARVVGKNTITTMSARCPRLTGTQARRKEKHNNGGHLSDIEESED